MCLSYRIVRAMDFTLTTSHRKEYDVQNFEHNIVWEPESFFFIAVFVFYLIISLKWSKSHVILSKFTFSLFRILFTVLNLETERTINDKR